MSYAAGCAGKNRAYGWAEAERVARRMRRDRHSNATPYNCGHCGGVHIGTAIGTNRLGRKIKIEKRRRMEQRWETEW